MQGEDLEYLAEANVVVLSEELVIQNISLHQATHPTEEYLFQTQHQYTITGSMHSLTCIKQLLSLPGAFKIFKGPFS
jgi:hypothetical protein